MNTQYMNTQYIDIDHNIYKTNAILNGVCTLFYICFIILASTVLVVYYIPYNVKPPDVFVYYPENIGSNLAFINGGIICKNKYDVQYRFEYGTGDYYVPNVTKWMAINTNSKFVTLFITDLNPNTRYVFRLVVKMNDMYFSSNKSYFNTLEAPTIRLSDINVDNTYVDFSGLVNTHSNYLNYAVQIKTDNADYHTYDPIRVSCFGPCTVLVKMLKDEFVKNVTYQARLMVFEDHANVYYHSNVKSFDI